MIFNVQNIWRIVIGILIAGILSVGGWVFSEVRDTPAKYESISDHKRDIDKTNGRVDRLEEKIVEQQTRIEEKVDETNRFLRDYLSTHN
jgi:hypothetical protein